MRKIHKDKSKILSTAYKKWVDKLDNDNKKHPKRSDTFYIDVMMNLLHCQKGVCAYTEMFLCESKLVTVDKWEKGKYTIENPGRFGEIDHFNPSMKKDKCWEWDNLFVVLGRINKLKGKKKVDERFKPDSPGYDPKKFLEYHVKTHRFRPRPDIKDSTLTKSIENMIKVLNINYGPICHERKSFLTKMFVYRKVNRPIKIDRFFTACRMTGLQTEEDE